MAIFDLSRPGEGEQAPAVLGRAEIDGAGKVTLLWSEAGAEDALAFALDDLNGRDALILKVAPGAGEPPFAVVKERIARGDPRFLEAMQDNLRRWHGMELVPVG